MINLKEENAPLNSTKDVYEFGVTLFKEKDMRVLLMELSEPIQFWFKNWLLIPILVNNCSRVYNFQFTIRM